MIRPIFYATCLLSLPVSSLSANEAEAKPAKQGKSEKADKADKSKKKQKEFFTPEADKKRLKTLKYVKDLPNVLILGDSISIAYTPFVIDGLKGKANVQRAKANCGDTKRGMRALKSWLEDTDWIEGGKWDVVHFNFGLHDLCYRHPDSKVYGRRDKVNGTIGVTLEQYEKNLTTIVTELKKTGAKLVWASTTKVPAGEAGRHEGDEIKYNKVAAKVMNAHQIPINDLHTASSNLPKEDTKPKDVHYNKEGSKKLGAEVVKAISAQLP